MKASFVIATYNRSADLERCVDSILLQRDCEFEVLVVDDASTDDTRDMVSRKYGDRVRLISRNENSGSIKNRNLGAEQASGEILFLIDDDTELPGVRTAREVLDAFADERVGAIAIPYLQDGELRQSFADNQVVASYVGCASAVRRDLFLSLGGYEEFFHHQVEEDDLCLRMLERGNFCGGVTVSVPMNHFESPVRNFQRWDYFGRRNSLLYVWKNCPFIYLIPNLLVTTISGVRHAFRIKRFRGNFNGLIRGYGAIIQSALGKGCSRNPVRVEVYRVNRRLRKGALPIAELNSIMPSTKE